MLKQETILTDTTTKKTYHCKLITYSDAVALHIAGTVILLAIKDGNLTISEGNDIETVATIKL